MELEQDGPSELTWIEASRLSLWTSTSTVTRSELALGEAITKVVLGSESVVSHQQSTPQEVGKLSPLVLKGGSR